MSMETIEWLNRNTLVGYTDKRGPAWHYRKGDAASEGNHFPGAVPVSRVDDLFGWSALALPFRVEIPEVITQDGVTPVRVVQVPDRVAIVHEVTGDVLGVFRDSYRVTQYREALVEKLSAIVGESRGDLGVGSAGLLRLGAVAWVMLEAPENRVAPNGFAFREHILATTSHDGTLANTYTECATAVVCDNTLAGALGERGVRRYSSKHSKHSVIDIADAQKALGILTTGGDALETAIMALTKKKVSAAKFGAFVEAWAPVPEDPKNTRGLTVAEKKRAALTELWNRDDRVVPWKGTAFGVVQAVNTYDQHVAAVRNGSGDEGGKGAVRYARSVLAAADGTLSDRTSDTRKLLATVGVL